ncbi:MAG: glycosyltransferase family 4 protein [Gemmatimonadota bacterium]
MDSLFRPLRRHLNVTPHVSSASDGRAASMSPDIVSQDSQSCPPVLLVTPWYGGNGVGLVVEGIAHALCDLGVTVAVFQLAPDGWLPHSRRGRKGELIVSVCLRPMSSSQSRSRRFAAQLRGLLAKSVVVRLVRRFGLKVAHFHYALPEYVMVHRICVQSGLQCLLTFHGSDVVVNMAEPRAREATALLLKSCRAVTAVSDALRRDVIALFPDSAPFTYTVHNAVPEDILAEALHATAGSRDIDVLFVGYLAPHKGADVLIQAIACVAKSVSPLRVVIAGDGPDAPKLARMVDELGIHRSVSFVGWKSRAELAPLYLRSRVLSVPSRREGFGLVVVEGQVCGAAVVASAVGGIPEIITDGRTGLMVSPDDSHALAAALTRLLQDEPARLAIAEAARTNALRKFSPTAMASRYCDVYRTASGARPEGYMVDVQHGEA